MAARHEGTQGEGTTVANAISGDCCARKAAGRPCIMPARGPDSHGTAVRASEAGGGNYSHNRVAGCVAAGCDTHGARDRGVGKVPAGRQRGRAPAAVTGHRPGDIHASARLCAPKRNISVAVHMRCTLLVPDVVADHDCRTHLKTAAVVRVYPQFAGAVPAATNAAPCSSPLARPVISPLISTSCQSCGQTARRSSTAAQQPQQQGRGAPLLNSR